MKKERFTKLESKGVKIEQIKTEIARTSENDITVVASQPLTILFRYGISETKGTLVGAS